MRSASIALLIASQQIPSSFKNISLWLLHLRSLTSTKRGVITIEISIYLQSLSTYILINSLYILLGLLSALYKQYSVLNAIYRRLFILLYNNVVLVWIQLAPSFSSEVWNDEGEWMTSWYLHQSLYQTVQVIKHNSCFKVYSIYTFLYSINTIKTEDPPVF